MAASETNPPRKASHVRQYGRELAFVAIAGVASALGYAWQKRTPRTPTSPAVFAYYPDWRTLGATGQAIGALHPRVTITEFSDFQCPFCARIAREAMASVRAHPNAVRLVFRHYPLPQHTYAFTAAIAAECAGKQGMFWTFHDVMFREQDSIGVLPWARAAREAGVRDTSQFAACLRNQLPASRITQDLMQGHRLHIAGTPAVFVDNHWYAAGITPAQLHDAVEAALHEAPNSSVAAAASP